jgi:hypothetical protein
MAISGRVTKHEGFVSEVEIERRGADTKMKTKNLNTYMD